MVSEPVIVTVIEAGPLERQVCLMARSLRRFGGRLAGAPIVAAMPRRGPKLEKTTRKTLAELNVNLAIISRDDGMDWFPYLNKTAALRFVARQVSGQILWLDADILVVSEPVQLVQNQRQFAACASDKNIGTARDDDEFAPYFRAACHTVGVNYETLPYVVTEIEGISIRAYWNSGVFLFESGSGLAEVHHEFTRKLVSQRVGSCKSKFFFSDQIALGLAVHNLKLTFSNLSLSHNYPVQPKDVLTILQSEDDIHLLHYHGCLWPDPFSDLFKGLKARNAEAARMLFEAGPLGDEKWKCKVARKLLQIYRRRHELDALRGGSFY
jgi:lipopolysaccharide biosynthesis glycosyltransferase